MELPCTKSKSQQSPQVEDTQKPSWLKSQIGFVSKSLGRCLGTLHSNDCDKTFRCDDDFSYEGFFCPPSSCFFWPELEKATDFQAKKNDLKMNKFGLPTKHLMFFNYRTSADQD